MRKGSIIGLAGEKVLHKTGDSEVETRKPKLGLALGGGAAKGWAHFGVIRVLREVGLAPDVVAGTSIGSLVGGAYCAGYDQELEQWVRQLQWQEVLGMLDLRFSGGLIHGQKVMAHLEEGMRETSIESLNPQYAAIATDVESGHEVWLRNGDLLTAIRASIALPGLFSPIKLQGRWLVDGGLVNPTPVSVCRAMGADVVIAVDLTALPVFRAAPRDDTREPATETAANENATTDVWRSADKFFGLIQGAVDRMQVQKGGEDESLPSTLDVMLKSLDILVHRVARSRIAGEPADLLISPQVEQIALMEFHRANEAIDLGYQEALRFQPELEQIKAYLEN